MIINKICNYHFSKTNLINNFNIILNSIKIRNLINCFIFNLIIIIQNIFLYCLLGIITNVFFDERLSIFEEIS